MEALLVRGRHYRACPEYYFEDDEDYPFPHGEDGDDKIFD
jgi:hypothetical protein